MKATGNTRLAVLVSAVAVAAVAIGGVVATSQGPQADDDRAGAASPLAARSGSTGTPGTTATDEPKFTGPVKVPLQLAKLKRGREPQVVFSAGRQISGGAGGSVVVPGSSPMLEFTRMGEEVFVVLSVDEYTSELLRMKYTGELVKMPDVISVVGTVDQSAVAYATQPRGKDGLNLPGGVVSALNRDGEPQNLTVRGVWGVRVLASVDGTVYYTGAASDGASAWKLYAWKPGDTAAKVVPTPGSPTAISRDGKLVALRTAPGEHRACSTVNDLATGRSLWRTCEYEVRSFTPDGRAAIATPPYDDGWASSSTAVLDVRNGNLLRQWTGAFFVTSQAEDDQHVLLLISDQETMPRGVLRCTITTGACESAVPLGGKRIGLGR